VSEPAAPHGTYLVTCPHCSRTFEADVLGGSAARYSGFKCPHCKLFVPFERVEDEVQPAT
jgi:DNA-directed RNA polymerase subunit RPC12/RpoP